MTTTSSKALERYNAGVVEVGQAARAQVERLLTAYIKKHGTDDVAGIRKYAILVMRSTINYYGEAAEEAAVEMWDLTLEAFGLEPMKLTRSAWAVDEQMVESVARYKAGHLVGESPEPKKFTSGCAEYVKDAVQFVAQDTTTALVEQWNYQQAQEAVDAASGTKWNGINKRGRRNWNTSTYQGGVEMRFARILQGEDSCTLCVTMAARGYVYKSRESALAMHHRGCDCGVASAPKGTKTDNWKKQYSDYKFFTELDGTGLDRETATAVKREFFHGDMETRTRLQREYLGDAKSK